MTPCPNRTGFRTLPGTVVQSETRKSDPIGVSCALSAGLVPIRDLCREHGVPESLIKV